MPRNGIYLIGLTGNIACGKSTVLGMLREYGAQVIDADRLTHDLQQPGEMVYAQIVAAFGSDILEEQSGRIDRRKLGAIVFSDPSALRRLEQIVHPAVHARIVAWLEDVARSGSSERGAGSEVPPEPWSRPPDSRPRNVAVIDAIKLLEAGWKPVCDAIWVVTCTPAQQLERLVATRGMSWEEARHRIAAQPPQADKVAQADVVIDNSGPLEETRRQIEQAWRVITDHLAASG